MLYYLGIGSNLGNREQTIREALRLLDEQVGRQLGVAPFIYSAPQGFSSNNEFCNTVALYESAMQPLEVLACTQAIEQQLGRTEHSTLLPDGTKQYADREIDIDLIEAYDNEGTEIRVNTPILTLPHPRMSERTFVLEPLRQLKHKTSTHKT